MTGLQKFIEKAMSLNSLSLTVLGVCKLLGYGGSAGVIEWWLAGKRVRGGNARLKQQQITYLGGCTDPPNPTISFLEAAAWICDGHTVHKLSKRRLTAD